MPISVLDARDTSAASALVLDAPARPAAPAGPARTSGSRRLPAPVVACAVLGLVESVALLAGSLTGLGRLLGAGPAPGGLLVAVVVVSLASWIVGCAGGAAVLVDAGGRRLVRWIAYGELALVAVLLGIGVLTADLDGLLPAALPLPVAALVALAVPVAKLLLAGAPATLEFLAAGPRPREPRPDPTRTHQRLCLATLAVIGVVLGVLALVVPPAGAGGGPGSSSVVSSTR